MKIVINNKYGGFNLSNEALAELRKRKGLDTYFYKQKFSDDYRDITYMKTDANNDDLFVNASPKDFGNKTDEVEYISSRDIERNDPDLISLVEEWGDRVNGKCAKLKVVEIPDDVEWTIEEYDGNEWVAEVHRTWS